jgi:hypothetical protein
LIETWHDDYENKEIFKADGGLKRRMAGRFICNVASICCGW